MGSTLIVDTSIGEIVLLDCVCCGCLLEIADQNLVDDPYSYYIMLYLKCHLWAWNELYIWYFKCLVRGKSLPLLPFWDYRWFVGVRLDLPTSSCTVCVEGVIVLVLDCFPIDKSEVTCEESPPIVVSPQTYFLKTCLNCCIFIALSSYSLC